jgi:hypothetical protein
LTIIRARTDCSVQPGAQRNAQKNTEQKGMIGKRYGDRSWNKKSANAADPNIRKQKSTPKDALNF